MDRNAAADLTKAFSGKRILVLGDFMLDQFLWGRVDRISPEAPVPVVDVDRESHALGGAGNVVMNLNALGATPIPLGVVGDDWAGDRLLRLLTEADIEMTGIFSTNRSTTLKTRIVAHQQQVVRVDREERSLLDPELQGRLIEQFLALLPAVDAVLISDYSKGTISPPLLKAILPEARRSNKLVSVDPKIRYFGSYSPITVVTPNQSEAAGILGYPIVSHQDLEEAGKKIAELIDCKALLITRGEKGMALFEEGKLTLVPTRAREVFDVTGAGDTVIAVLTLALAAGADMLNAVQLSNIAAGVVVGKVGTATVTPAELLSQLEE